MRKERLEAFSDGVLAIIITVMILELKCRPAVFISWSHLSGWFLTGGLRLFSKMRKNNKFISE
jgi:uncharacterized membrane protein